MIKNDRPKLDFELNNSASNGAQPAIDIPPLKLSEQAVIRYFFAKTSAK
jgi:hypothetical protein